MNPELLAKIAEKREELGPNWLLHEANRVAFKPAKLSLLESFVLRRRHDQLQGG